MNEESTLSGWWVFAGVLLLVAGVLNIIYGIAAIGDSKFFTENADFIISGLNTWGWILLIVGVLELVAAFSLFSGGEFGRWFGIFIASLNAMGALLSIPAYPFWSLAIFALCDHHHLQARRGPGRNRQLGEDPTTSLRPKAPGIRGLRRCGAGATRGSRHRAATRAPRVRSLPS